MIRKIFFWAHLVSGVLAGIVVFTMSLTGVLLTYERQMLAWSSQTLFLPEEEQSASRLPLEQLIFIAKAENPDFTPTAVVITNNPGAPVEFRAGRTAGASLNPYTGEEMAEPSPGLENFFRTVTGLHRWFNISGDNRGLARDITGYSNLIFLFLILSGMYLWLPRLWKWGIFKARLLFASKSPNSKARDFNWHHVFGIWSAIPLVVVVATATVFSFSWSNSLVYIAYGEEVPVRGPRGAAGPSQPMPDIAAEQEYLSIDKLLKTTDGFIDNLGGGWRQISINLPDSASPTIQFAIDQGNGGQPHLRHNLTLQRETAEVSAWQPFDSQTPARQTRSIIRFLHTGEALGVWGQTIAGLVSIASLFMVWTGLALSYRRLIQPLFRKKP